MSALPPALAPWGESLAALDAALAVSIGPLVRHVDGLVSRVDDGHHETGEPDGYDGTTNRGHPDRLLADEWLLADEVPLEFLRRAAEGELRYLRTAHRSTPPRGGVVAVVDAGPDQLGAGRLVQLAALVVLDRRARSCGADLTVVDARTGRSSTGTLAVLVPWWLQLRSAERPDPERVGELLADLDRGESCWLLSGPSLAGALGERRRGLRSRPVEWGDAGVARIELRVGSATDVLDVPTGRAVAALRGQGLIRSKAPTLGRVTGSDGISAAFTSAARSLLWRGTGGRQLHRMPVGEGNGKPRAYQLPGTLVAAAVLGQRTVALVTDGTTLRGHVIGKRMPAATRAQARLGELGFSSADLESIVAGRIRPLHLSGDSLLVWLRGSWWRLSDEAPERLDRLRDVRPSAHLDHPRMVWELWSPRASADVVVAKDEVAVLGPVGWHARRQSEKDGVWVAIGPDGAHQHVTLRPDHEVLGLVVCSGEPRLVTRSRGGEGRLVCLVGPGLNRMLTDWAGPASYSVHPQQPWLVRATGEDARVLDLDSGATLARVRFDR